MTDEQSVTGGSGVLSHGFGSPGLPTAPGPPGGPRGGLPVGPPSGLTLSAGGGGLWRPTTVTQLASGAAVSRGQESTAVDVGRLAANMQVPSLDVVC